jgi:hypothetical protein
MTIKGGKMKRSSLMLWGLIFLMISGAQGATYYWTGATDLSWSTAANWSPVRSVGVVTDTLIFSADSTVHDTVVGGTTETVAFIKVTSGTSIWFQTASGKQIMSLNDSLVVEPGANLSVISPTAAADTLVIYLNANARGTVDGTITFNYYGTTTGPRHRLDAADTLAIQFNSGSSLVQNTIGNIFGASAGSNRVVFNSGSQFIQYLGSNPFGLGQPSSKVLFKPGSWFRFRQGGTPSFSGRTYANFELNYQATITGTGASPLTMDSLLITDGHLNLQLRHINLKGAVIVYDTLYFNSATTCSLYLNGTTQQTMDWSAANSFMLGAATNVFVDNPSGLLLNSNFVVNCKLHLTNGNIVTDANSVLLTTDSTIVRGTGYIQGTLWQVVNSGTLVAKNYPVGNDAGYTPVSFNFGNVTAGGGLSVTVVHNTHPDASIPENTMQNYWSVSSTGGFLFDTCSATLNYLSSDFNTGFSEIIDEETMVAGKRDTSVWAFPNIVSRDTANNMITMDGLIGFSDFTLAKNQDALIPDTIAPYIVSTSPADGDSNVALDQAVLVVFSEPIDTSVFSGNNVPAHPMTMSWNGTLDTLTLTPDSLYEYLTTYTFTVTGGTDLSGNLIAGLPVSFSFTTIVGDTIKPTITGTSPANGATEVALSAVIYVAFSEPMDTLSLIGDMVPSPNENPTWNATMDTLFLTHDPMALNTVYTVRIAGINDLAGNPLAVLPDSFSFTTIVGDTVKPVISGTSPANGATEVALDAVIYVAFSEPMDTLSLIGSMTPSPNEEPTWNATMDTLILVHDPLTTNTTYKIVITGIYDLVGNPLAVLPDSFSFTTIVGDTVKPYIVSTSPADGDSNVVLDADVVMIFSEPIDTLSFMGYNSPLHPMNMTWSATMDTLTLTPAIPFSYNTTYTFYDTAGTDLAGNPIAGLPVSFSFTTLPTGVEGRPGTIPNSFYLMPVSPNPVRQGAEFRFGLSQSGKTTLEIYNVLGQKVKILSDGFLSAGNHTIKWNGCDENGRKVSSGAYVYRLVTGNQTCTKRFAVIK